ncbi:reverse transcriptase domain-containing protein [Tanacetum coccineum]
MRTRSSSNLVGNSSSNPTTSNPKRRNRRRSKQPFSLEESPVVTMADQRTMAELLRAPTEGYAEAIVVPPILAEHFELKHSLINMMTSDQFFGLEKDNPHDHIRWFNKITSTIKYKDVPNSAIKLMLFPFSLAGAAQVWTNHFMSLGSIQRSLHASPHHGFTELHQLDTFYNALNPADQDSLNSAAGGNLLERSTQDVLTIIENKSKEDLVSKFINEFLPPSRTTNLRNEISNFKQRFGESFHEAWDRYKDLLRAFPHHGFTELHQLTEWKSVKKSKSTKVKVEAETEETLNGPSVPMPPLFVNPKEDERVEETLTDPEHGDPGKFLIPCGFTELKCKALADLGASINLMPLSVWKKLGLPELISTQMTLELANRAICTPEGIARDVFVPVGKFTFPANFVIVDYESDPRVPLILGRPFLRTARALIDVHGEEMILRDGNERLTLNMRHDTSSYSTQPHQESINMIDVYNVSHEEILEDLFATNHPSGNPTSSLTSHTDLTSPEVNDDIFDPEGDIIENLLNLDKTKDLPPYHDNPLSGNPTPISEPVTKSSSSSPTLTSIEESDLIWEEFEAYLASDSFPPGNSNPSSPLPPFHNSLSGSTTSSSPSLPISETSDYSLEEFADELAHFTFPPGIDYLPFDAESDLREIEYLLNHDPIKEMDSILEDSVDSPYDNLVDTIPEMFTDEHALDYSSPPLWDDYDDKLFDLETVNDNTYDDPFDFKEEKIKESKLLIDELNLPGSSDFLPSPECDSVFYEDFSEIDALPSTDNEDKIFNP